MQQHNAVVISQNRMTQILKELSNYITELPALSQNLKEDALAYWNNRKGIYANLAPFAQDLISAPASQAFVEKIFSLCGISSDGRRNRMKKNLEMRVFLKLNWSLISVMNKK